MGKVNDYYVNVLEPLKSCRVEIGSLWRYGQITLKRKETEVSVLLEYDADDSEGKKRSWIGIYYGVLHDASKPGLSKDEISLVQEYFLNSFWRLHHPLDTHKVKNIFIDGESSEQDSWDFWIRHREEDSIADSLSAMNVLVDGLKLIGFQESN